MIPKKITKSPRGILSSKELERENSQKINDTCLATIGGWKTTSDNLKDIYWDKTPDELEEIFNETQT
jgi:hypothetical protein